MSIGAARVRLRQLIALTLAWLTLADHGPVVAAPQILPNPVVYRLVFDAAKPELTQALPEGVAVLESVASTPEALASEYLAALSGAGRAFAGGSRLQIVSVGPLLDQPDRVTARLLQRVDGEFRLQIEFTRVRREADRPLFKNLVWRPLVQAPLAALPVGSHRVAVQWRVVDSASGRKLPKLAPLSQSTTFEIAQ